MSSIRRFIPLSLGMAVYLLGIVLPQVLMRRMGLPWWPWFIVFWLPFAAVSTVLIELGRRYLRRWQRDE